MAFENNVQATLQANVAIGATTVDVLKAVAPNKDVPASGRLTLSATGKTEIISLYRSDRQYNLLDANRCH